MRRTVVVVETGAANTASVMAALDRLGACGVRAADPDAVRGADRVVLPGVGAFGPAMDRLVSTGQAEALIERIQADRPTLSICLGFQLLFRSSEESPGVAGLSVIDASISAFSEDVLVPQMGWNQVRPGRGSTLQPGWAYFANSFKADALPSDWGITLATHGRPFVAAAERGGVLACQFHPELSGAWGKTLLERWLC